MDIKGTYMVMLYLQMIMSRPINSVEAVICPDCVKILQQKLSTRCHVNTKQCMLPQRFAENDMPDADAMQLIDQESAYSQCGMKIKSDLLGKCNFIRFSILRRQYNVMYDLSSDQPLRCFQPNIDRWQCCCPLCLRIIGIRKDLHGMNQRISQPIKPLIECINNLSVCL